MVNDKSSSSAAASRQQQQEINTNRHPSSNMIMSRKWSSTRYRPLIAYGLTLVVEWSYVSVTTIIVNYQIYTFFCAQDYSSKISSVIHVALGFSKLTGVRIEVEKSRKKFLFSHQTPQRDPRDWTNSYLVWHFNADEWQGIGFDYLMPMGNCTFSRKFEIFITVVDWSRYE